MVFLIPVLILSSQLLNAQSHCFQTSYTSYQVPDSVIIIHNTLQVKDKAEKELRYDILDDVLIIKESQEGDVFNICFNYTPEKY